MSQIEFVKPTASAAGYAVVHVGSPKIPVKVRQWTMGQRSELKPLVAKVLAGFTGLTGQRLTDEMADLFDEMESEVFEIVRASVELPDGFEFDHLPWGDLPLLAEAVWKTNVVTEDGGGLAGKLRALMPQGQTRPLMGRMEADPSQGDQVTNEIP